MVKINGFCNEQFASVKDAFAKNFDEGLDVGASFAATVNGKFVIDIWGGHRDAAQTEPWEEDTIVTVYSTTKIMTAICTLMCVDRGLLDLDAPVATYWPEFAQGGKEKIPVRYLLSHTSGLSGWEKPIQAETLYNWEKSVSLLAAQEPWWEPGTKSGYHAVTFGHLLGELVRRVSGRTIGTFFKEEVADPLGADFHIGLPEDQDYRVGELIPPPQMDASQLGDFKPNPIGMKTFISTAVDPKDTKTRDWLGAEVPAINGQGNARSVARIASALACGGEVDDVRLLSSNTIDKTLEEQSNGIDLVLMMPMRFGLGFGLQSELFQFGSGNRMLWWGGWGGSVCIMDLDNKVSIAYVMNKMAQTLTADPRSARPIKAFYDSFKLI
ncbi:MAG: serine hydrolase domain-containing protein [Promethearchaeota archaeon]